MREELYEFCEPRSYYAGDPLDRFNSRDLACRYLLRCYQVLRDGRRRADADELDASDGTGATALLDALDALRHADLRYFRSSYGAPSFLSPGWPRATSGSDDEQNDLPIRIQSLFLDKRVETLTVPDESCCGEGDDESVTREISRLRRVAAFRGPPEPDCRARIRELEDELHRRWRERDERGEVRMRRSSIAYTIKTIADGVWNRSSRRDFGGSLRDKNECQLLVAEARAAQTDFERDAVLGRFKRCGEVLDINEFDVEHRLLRAQAAGEQRGRPGNSPAVLCCGGGPML